MEQQPSPIGKPATPRTEEKAKELGENILAFDPKEKKIYKVPHPSEFGEGHSAKEYSLGATNEEVREKQEVRREVTARAAVAEDAGMTYTEDELAQLKLQVVGENEERFDKSSKPTQKGILERFVSWGKRIFSGDQVSEVELLEKSANDFIDSFHSKVFLLESALVILDGKRQQVSPPDSIKIKEWSVFLQWSWDNLNDLNRELLDTGKISITTVNALTIVTEKLKKITTEVNQLLQTLDTQADSR